MEIDRTIVQSFPLFSRLCEKDLDSLLSCAVLRRVAQGDTVFKQGESAQSFFLLLNGRVKIMPVSMDGHQFIMRLVNPGEVFGFVKAILRSEYPATAQTATEVLLLGWTIDAWTNFVERHAHLNLNAMQIAGQRLGEAQLRIREMSTQFVKRRLANVVLRLAQQAGRNEGDGILIDFPISRKDIAEMTGTTLHNVSRILSSWEARGVVTNGREKLIVRDMIRLSALANGSLT